jgi:hypothetical protein
MAMNSDFLDAHERHWEDAELLKGEGRLANADHMYGMSAECGLKRLMIGFGMTLDSSGLPPDKDRKHADAIWDRFEAYRSGHHNGAGYALPPRNPFTDWDVSQRYAARKEFEHARVVAHWGAAETVKKLVRKARKEGLI